MISLCKNVPSTVEFTLAGNHTFQLVMTHSNIFNIAIIENQLKQSTKICNQFKYYSKVKFLKLIHPQLFVAEHSSISFPFEIWVTFQQSLKGKRVFYPSYTFFFFSFSVIINCLLNYATLHKEWQYLTKNFILKKQILQSN